MKKSILTGMLLLGAMVSPAQANDVDKAVETVKDNPGMAIGTGVGGAVGGPGGALIGAGAGAVADNVAREIGNFFRGL